MRTFLSILLLLAFCPPSIACSFGPGFADFRPDTDSFEQKFDANGEFIAMLPAPTVTIERVQRGTASPGSSCDDAGIMEVRIDWPTDSRYKLDEIGFYFRAPLDALPDLIFPLEPIAPLDAAVKENTAYFMFVWLDGHPRRQKPLKFPLEVFAVNHGLQIGESTIVDVDE